MADPVPNPHDALFRKILARPADAASELRAVLPEKITAHIEWDTLELQPGSYITQDLRSRYSDLVFRARIDNRTAYLTVFIEHQSSPDPLMPLRMLEYVTGFLTQHVHTHRSTTVPAVLALAIHAGPDGRRWSYPTELSELFDLDPATREDLGEYLPRFRILLDDLTVHDVPALRARHLTPPTPLTYVFQQSNISDTEFEPITEQVGSRAREALMTLAEQLKEKGRAEGEARGEARGRAETLVEQLESKFGPLPAETVAMVRAARIAQVRQWAARVLTADTIDAVFQ
ncbi:hypothetical protein HLB23_21155 [Nocardia uniformis]|uniref:Transposase (putative) YhgA-like domain-containing protein n=1 Tax=Nocardia uniformis TaxID=53432 RepID=A0A849C410_9NOCA|nr:Rpn family recombination-promoting nuclease/putative transposase [Nocardia uniformis]NNH72336.1 hypothetical protein [Nocardia uniformis]